MEILQFTVPRASGAGIARAPVMGSNVARIDRRILLESEAEGIKAPDGD